MKTVSEKQAKRAVDLNDDELSQLEETVVEELGARRDRRKDLESQWKEVDRQVDMKPENSHKLLANGQPDAGKAWMPEGELPLQAETLEMLTADTRRLQFPRQGIHFAARAALTAKYLDRYDAAKSPIPNDEQNEGSILAQDNADKLVEGFLHHWHRKYDMRAQWDRMHSEVFKYSVGIGRICAVKTRMMSYDGKGVERKIPMLIPRCTWNTYLDDSQQAVMHEGVALGPNIIQTRKVVLADLIATSKAGGADAGWLVERIAGLPFKSDEEVELIELEGDVVTERDNESKLYRDMLITIVKENKGSRAVVRVRKRPSMLSSYIVLNYHHEGAASAYCASPLTKGRSIAFRANQSLNRVIESALLKTQPPISYGESMTFNAEGGPVIHPGAQWKGDDPINVYTEVGGDPQALMAVYRDLLGQYQDVSGVNAPRMGAQTVSHTTAFAKDAEMQRGVIRTVDYVDSVLSPGGPAEQQLEVEYRMALQLMGSRKELVYIPDWKEFVEIGREHLPETVYFNAIGAGAPAEQEAEMRRKLDAAQLALQVDAAAVQLGRQPQIDHGAMVQQILREGGWNEVDAIITGGPDAAAGAADAAGMGPAIGGAPGVVSATPTLQDV